MIAVVNGGSGAVTKHSLLRSISCDKARGSHETHRGLSAGVAGEQMARFKEPHATRDWSAESAHTKATPRKRDLAEGSATSNAHKSYHINNL